MRNWTMPPSIVCGPDQMDQICMAGGGRQLPQGPMLQGPVPHKQFARGEVCERDCCLSTVEPRGWGAVHWL
jgi:hypothetical protein